MEWYQERYDQTDPESGRDRYDQDRYDRNQWERDRHSRYDPNRYNQGRDMHDHHDRDRYDEDRYEPFHEENQNKQSGRNEKKVRVIRSPKIRRNQSIININIDHLLVLDIDPLLVLAQTVTLVVTVIVILSLKSLPIKTSIYPKVSFTQGMVN